MLLVRVVAAVCALVAGTVAAVAVDQHLLLGSLREGFAYGYRLPDLALLSAVAAVCWLCGYAVWRALRPGWDVVLLSGPAVLAALALERSIPRPRYEGDSGYFIAVASDDQPHLWVDLVLTSLAVAVGLGVPTLALLRSRRGRRPPDLAPPP